MFDRLKHRAEKPELMDDRSAGGRDLRQAYRHLSRLNRIFGAAGPTLYGIKRLWCDAGRPKQLSILDIGCGYGDVNRPILRWADNNSVRMMITLADRSEEACEEARRLYKDEPRIEVIKCDLFTLPERCADIVTATQFVHHFSSLELQNVVRKLLQTSRMGIVINDIHRHWIPWLAVFTVTRLISRNTYIRHDGPLSVAKGFRATDWQSLKQSDVASDMSYYWRPLFRYVVTARKMSPVGRGS